MPRGDKRADILPPAKGLKSDAPSHLVPDGHFTDGLNVIARDGIVLVRPGYTTLSSAPFSDPGMGGIYYKDNALSEWVLAASKTKIKEWDGTNWTDRTGTDLTGGDNDQVRMALFQTSTVSTVLITNNEDVPRKQVATGNSADLGGLGDIQKARDVTVTFQRAILGNVVLAGTRGPSTLMISDKDDFESWPAVNQVDLSDTADTIVAVRALNTQMFAVYKDNSQWIGIGSVDVFPFEFELKAQMPGPVSPSAVVEVFDVHYYLAIDGNVYKFDGSRVTSVGDAVRRTLQSVMNFLKFDRAHGFFDGVKGDIWWFFNSVNSTAEYPDYGISYNINNQSWSSLHSFGHIISASMKWTVWPGFGWNDLTGTWDSLVATYPTWNSFPQSARILHLIFDESGNVYRFGDSNNDNGTAMGAHFTYPLRDYTGAGRKVRVDAVESYWKLNGTGRNVDVILITSDDLTDDGSEETAQSFDLGTAGRKVAEYVDVEARFISIKQRLTNAHNGDEFRGMTLHLYDRAQATGDA